jgi:hypothetical protein
MVSVQYLKVVAMHSVRDMSISNDLIVSGVLRYYNANFYHFLLSGYKIWKLESKPKA